MTLSLILNAAIISFALALIFRAIAVIHARKNPKISERHRSASERDVVPFNSPLQLAREIEFFSTASKSSDRLGLLSIAFIILLCLSFTLLFAFMLVSLL